jgi:chromosomal replication initiator protein
MEEEEKKISMEKVQRLVSEYFHIKVSDMRSKRRTKSVAEPRQIAMYLIRTLTTHSFPEIGEYFGGRDHTTVLHACNKVSKDVLADTRKLRMIEEIKDMLKRNA